MQDRCQVIFNYADSAGAAAMQSRPAAVGHSAPAEVCRGASCSQEACAAVLLSAVARHVSGVDVPAVAVV